MAETKIKPQEITNSYIFSAYGTTDQTPSATTWTLVNMNAEEYDVGSNYDTSTNKFTAPVTGYYHFDMTLLFLSQAGYPILIALGKNWTSGAETYRLAEIPNCGGNTTMSGSTTIKLTAGDTICPLCYTTQAKTLGKNPVYNHFSGYLVTI